MHVVRTHKTAIFIVLFTTVKTSKLQYFDMRLGSRENTCSPVTLYDGNNSSVWMRLSFITSVTHVLQHARPVPVFECISVSKTRFAPRLTSIRHHVITKLSMNVYINDNQQKANHYCAAPDFWGPSFIIVKCFERT